VFGGAGLEKTRAEGSVSSGREIGANQSKIDLHE